ncbi:MAG: hypothetical protein KDC95_02625 [Planctomycetes bacterium]|nr:hypothetical protein [Planctomycetota bacterium]
MIRPAELSISGVATGIAAVLFSTTALTAQTASYTTFGSNCPNSVGHIVPNVATTTWGNTGNAWTLGAANQRWQQEIDAVEMPNRPYQMTSLQWREDNVTSRTNPAHTLQLKILFGMTTMSSSTMTGTFATNATGAQTVVFDGPMSLPAVPGGNLDLGKFHYVAKFKAPYLYIPRSGQNFLIEIINTTATAVRRYPDAFDSSSTMGTRVYANNNSAALTGTLDPNHMMVLGFGNTSSSPAPVLSATGTPKIGTQFSVDCGGLTATTAAGLILGASKTVWGAFNLPLDLTGAGAPGCSLLVSFDVVSGLPIVSGSGKVTFTIPNQSSLAGVVFHNQFFVLDAAANAMKLTWSNAGTATIGN